MANINCIYCNHTMDQNSMLCKNCGKPIQHTSKTYSKNVSYNQFEKEAEIKATNNKKNFFLIMNLLISIIAIIGATYIHNNELLTVNLPSHSYQFSYYEYDSMENDYSMDIERHLYNDYAPRPFLLHEIPCDQVYYLVNIFSDEVEFELSQIGDQTDGTYYYNMLDIQNLAFGDVPINFEYASGEDYYVFSDDYEDFFIYDNKDNHILYFYKENYYSFGRSLYTDSEFDDLLKAYPSYYVSYNICEEYDGFYINLVQKYYFPIDGEEIFYRGTYRIISDIEMEHENENL